MDKQATIRTEYRRLCDLLEIREATLDIYEADEAQPADQATPYGTPLLNQTPLYNATKKLLVLPQLDMQEGAQLPGFPPNDWGKANWSVWPMWRIELWHETIHQLADSLAVHDPAEPPRIREDGTQSSTGHGEGWWTAIEEAARRLNVSPIALDQVLDR
jgi:hypothetical protein